MSDTINWAKLVSQGRAKAHGVPWNEEEAVARANGVPADDIRSGAWEIGDPYGNEVKAEEGQDVPKTEEDLDKAEEVKAKKTKVKKAKK